MKVTLAATNHAHVAVDMVFDEAMLLADALEKARPLLSEAADRERLDKDAHDRITDFYVELKLFLHEALHRAHAQVPRTPPSPVVVSVESINAACPLPSYDAIVASNVPVEHREWTVRVYRCDLNRVRDPNETLARVFDKEEKARDFFSRTQNVWNARVLNGEATAYEVALGVQDNRKHLKKKTHRELERALCKG